MAPDRSLGSAGRQEGEFVFWLMGGVETRSLNCEHSNYLLEEVFQEDDTNLLVKEVLYCNGEVEVRYVLFTNLPSEEEFDAWAAQASEKMKEEACASSGG